MATSTPVVGKIGKSRGSGAARPPRSRGVRAAWLLLVVVAAVIVGAAAGRLLSPSPSGPALTLAPSDEGAAEIDRLSRRVAEAPADVAAWQQLGVTATRRAALTGDAALYALAARAFDGADAAAPDQLGTLVGRGNLNLSLHDFTTARALGERAVALAPRNVAALGVLVDAQVELGAYDDAAETLQRMLDASPALPALARASYLRELHGDLDGAVRALRQAVVAGGDAAYDVASVTALLGDLHGRRGDLAAADRAYTEALQDFPGLPPAVIGKARVLAASGDRTAALALLRDLTERMPHPGALILRSELAHLQGGATEAARADELVRAVASLQEANGQIVDLEMALYEADRGDDPGRAVALARRAHAARPDNVFVNDALAWALHRSGDSEAAAPFMRRALRLGSRDPLLRFHAAVIHAANGDLDRARTDLAAAEAGLAWAAPQHVAEAAALRDRLSDG